MKLFTPIALLLFILAVNTTAFGDSEGYAACHGDGVMAFDRAGEDNNGLYIVTWGTPAGISRIFRIALPRPHGPYSQGLKCEKDKVSILMRGVPPVSETKELTKYKMYITEISLKDRMNPQIISDKPNHYQVWTNYAQRSTESLEDGTPIASLPEPNLDLNDCGKKAILLESADPSHGYRLVFDNSKSKSNVRNGHGTITHRCETFLVMRDKDGKVIKKVEIADARSLETID